MVRGMGWAVAVMVAVGIAGGAEAAEIDECTSRNKRPTFVWHESEASTLYYVEPGGTFTPMASARQAQEICRSRGVRQRLRGRDCTMVDWDYFACGCNVAPPPNRTCDMFQRFLGVMVR